MEEQLRNPSPSLEDRIESAKRRAQQVRVKIQQDLVRRLHLTYLSFCFSNQLTRSDSAFKHCVHGLFWICTMMYNASV